MINNAIEDKSLKKEEPESNKKPNELGGIIFSSHLKIFDPNTKEVIVQKRADD